MAMSYSNDDAHLMVLKNKVEELEHRIRVANEKYDHLFENAPSGVYEIDFLEQRIVSCNNEILRYTGYSDEEFYELNFLDILSEDSKVKFLERFQNLLEGKEVDKEPEYQVRKKDGSLFWARLNPTYIYEEGTLKGAHVIVHDISYLKDAEEEIRLTKSKFEDFFKNAQELIVVLQNGEIKVINRLTLEVGGYSDMIMEGKDFIDFIHPDDREEVVERYFRRMAGEDVKGTNLMRLLTVDGTYRWAEVKSVLIEWEGKPATINFMNDVTARLDAEKGLKDTEKKYQLVVENTKDAIVILQDANVKFLNDRTPELLGYQKDEMESISFIDLVHPDDRKKMIVRYLASMDGKKVITNELVKFLHKDGSLRYGQVNNVLIEWEGKPATIIFVSDVTQRIIAEEKANLERSKSEFYLDLLGHDIRNLMQGISSWLGLAWKYEKMDESIKHFLDQTWHLSERSKRLVKNVLLLSKIRDREPSLAPLDLVPIIRRTVSDTIDNFPGKDVDMDLEIEPGEIKILAEPLVEEVFYNIIHNAIKFQNNGKARVRISIIKGSDGSVRIEVKDWGPGIPPKYKEEIFLRFNDVTNTRSSGIGLSLTKEIIDRYGGSITAKDNIEHGDIVGSRFIVQFPLGS